VAITFPTFRETIQRRLADCLNATELYGVRCRIDDANGLSRAERLELYALHDRRAAEVRTLYREWRKRNGLPEED
jgi:hypothetical protein